MNLDGSEGRVRFMSMRKRMGVLVAGAILAGSAGARGSDTATVHWQGEEYALDALPSEITTWPRRAITEWSEFAGERGYRMELGEDGRVLLLVQSKRAPKKQLRLIEKTLELFDAHLPVPPIEASGTVKPAVMPSLQSGTTGSGRGQAPLVLEEGASPPDQETIVLLQAKGGADYRAALTRITELQPYLAPWASGSQGTSGFVLERPLIGAWYEDGPGQEEWDAENELVHRLMRLLVLRRFSQQPYWLSLGIAWFAEIELKKSVYCLPYRDGFVFAAEHTSWGSRLRRFAKKYKDGVGISDLTRLRRGSYDEAGSLFAWGTAKHLASLDGEVLSRILQDFRNLRDEKGIQRTGNTWQRLADFEVSPEDQLAVFQARAGEDILADLHKSFRKAR